MVIKLNYSKSNVLLFSVVSEEVGLDESESEVTFLILPSPKLLKMKLKTPFGPPSICISNERYNRVEERSCWNRQLKINPFSETDGEV